MKYNELISKFENTTAVSQKIKKIYKYTIFRLKIYTVKCIYDSFFYLIVEYKSS